MVIKVLDILIILNVWIRLPLIRILLFQFHLKLSLVGLLSNRRMCTFGSSVDISRPVLYHTRTLYRDFLNDAPFVRLSLDLPTPTLSLLRDLQVG
jgi:hypothetical protein